MGVGEFEEDGVVGVVVVGEFGVWFVGVEEDLESEVDVLLLGDYWD